MLIAFGILGLAGVSIFCFAAYNLKARSFELSTAILKVVSFTVRINSGSESDDDSMSASGRSSGRHVKN